MIKKSGIVKVHQNSFKIGKRSSHMCIIFVKVAFELLNTLVESKNRSNKHKHVFKMTCRSSALKIN